MQFRYHMKDGRRAIDRWMKENKLIWTNPDTRERDIPKTDGVKNIKECGEHRTTGSEQRWKLGCKDWLQPLRNYKTHTRAWHNLLFNVIFTQGEP